MLVELKGNWFAPTEVVVRDKIQQISGRHYKRGVHEIMDELKTHLPSSAKIVSIKPDEEVVEMVDDITSFDTERAAGDAFVEMAEEAEKTLKEKRQENMARARAAKAAKKKE